MQTIIIINSKFLIFQVLHAIFQTKSKRNTRLYRADALKISYVNKNHYH